MPNNPLPWMKLWVDDLQNDPGYRRCSAFGKALWIQALCEMHRQDTYEIEGWVEELARLLSLNVGDVERGLEELETYDVADVDGIEDDGTVSGFVRLVSRRRLREFHAREKDRLRKREERSAALSGEGVDDVSNDSPSNVHQSSPSRARDCARTGLSLLSSSDSKAEGSVEAEKRLPVRQETESSEAVDRQFDEMWEVYDYKVGKKAARKAWGKLTPRQRGMALGLVKRYVDNTDPDGANGLTRRAHLATWLNGERWTDQHEPKTLDRKSEGTRHLTARQHAGLSIEEQARRAGLLD